MEGYKNRYEKVQRMIRSRVTDMEKKIQNSIFLLTEKMGSGIKRANILEFEVVMLFLKIQAKTGLIT